MAWLARGLWLAAGIAVLALAGGLGGLWQAIDHAVYLRLSGAAPPEPAPGLRLVDIATGDGAQPDERPAGFRRRVAEVLQALAATGRAPQTVVLDIWFSADPADADAVIAGITALQARGTRVVGAINLVERHGGRSRNPLASHNARIYREALDAFGHAELRHGQGLLSYERDVPIEAGGDPRQPLIQSLPALPIAATIDPARLALLPERLVVPLGDDHAFDARIVRIALTGQPLGADERMRLATLSGASHVVIGSLAADSDNVLNRPGPLLIAWAMSDLLAGRASEQRMPLNRPEVAALLALAAALAAGAAAIGAFQALRSRIAPSGWYRLAIACLLPGAAAGLALLATAQAIALAGATVLPLAWPAACALFAALLATHANRRWVDRARTRLEQQQATLEQAIQHDVFVSYAHDPAENRDWVRDRIVRPLAALTGADGRPLRVFFDERSIEAGRSWKREIELALLGSRCFVPVYSSRYFDRPYCREEIELADQLRIEGRLAMIPVARVTAGIPERYLRKIQYLDAAGGAEVSDALCERIRQVLGLGARPGGQAAGLGDDGGDVVPERPAQERPTQERPARERPA